MRSKFSVLAVTRALAVSAVLACAAATGVSAQGQPTSVNPTASSVNEQKLLDALKPETGTTAAVKGRVSIPDQRSGNLIQPAGKDWREFHQTTLTRIGIVAILGMIGLIGVFYAIRGRVRLSSGFSGRMIERFGSVERFGHWLAAVSFVALGLSGLNLTFGKSLLLPLVGPDTFSAISQLGKYVHNYVSFAFVLGLVLMFVMWIKDNFPHPRDLVWIAQGGGIVGNAHPPAGRFNFGQKLIFWSVILGGTGLAVTGYVLMFPFSFTDLGGMQLAGTIHGLIGVVLVAIIIAHIYIGTLGMEGAFSAMGTGHVDLNWAKEHHSVWAEKVVKNNPKAVSGAPGRGPVPAE